MATSRFCLRCQRSLQRPPCIPSPDDSLPSSHFPHPDREAAFHHAFHTRDRLPSSPSLTLPEFQLPPPPTPSLLPHPWAAAPLSLLQRSSVFSTPLLLKLLLIRGLGRAYSTVATDTVAADSVATAADDDVTVIAAAEDNMGMILMMLLWLMQILCSYWRSLDDGDGPNIGDTVDEFTDAGPHSITDVGAHTSSYVSETAGGRPCCCCKFRYLVLATWLNLTCANR